MDFSSEITNFTWYIMSNFLYMRSDVHTMNEVVVHLISLLKLTINTIDKHVCLLKRAWQTRQQAKKERNWIRSLSRLWNFQSCVSHSYPSLSVCLCVFIIKSYRMEVINLLLQAPSKTAIEQGLNLIFLTRNEPSLSLLLEDNQEEERVSIIKVRNHTHILSLRTCWLCVDHMIDLEDNTGLPCRGCLWSSNRTGKRLVRTPSLSLSLVWSLTPRCSVELFHGIMRILNSFVELY